jgi:hypothetical protein
MPLYLHPLEGLKCNVSVGQVRKLATGALAQLVEQRTENPCVPGSIPGGTTIKNPNKMFGFFGF